MDKNSCCLFSCCFLNNSCSLCEITVYSPIFVEKYAILQKIYLLNNSLKTNRYIAGGTMLSNRIILLADENQEARSRLKNFLEEEGAAILEAYDGACALEIFQEKQNKIDLIIIDVILPVYDGWTVCREIRKHSMAPIIILTSRNADFDEIHGLEIGADDYLRKSVNMEVLSARIKALLRRTQPQDSHAYYFGGLTIEPSSHKVNVNQQEINLSPKEYQILVTLAKNKGRIISREELFHKVWGYQYYAGLRTVDTHINRLREKLHESGGYIHTIRGFGYRFDGDTQIK